MTKLVDCTIHFEVSYIVRQCLIDILQVSKNGLTNSVLTFYELSNGDDTEGEGKADL